MMRFRRLRLKGLTGLVLVVVLFLTSIRYPSDFWAAIMILLTANTFCWATLGVVYRRGNSRSFWLGFNLFGLVYLTIVSPSWLPDTATQSSMPTTKIISLTHAFFHPVDMRPNGARGALSYFFAGFVHDPEAVNIPIREALEQKTRMSFAEATPIEDVLQYVKSSTTSNSLPAGVPYYFERASLGAPHMTVHLADKCMVQIELEGVPLRKSLSLVLDQLFLTYQIEDGLIHIRSRNQSDTPIPWLGDSFSQIGHCWFALLIGLIGGRVACHLQKTGTREGV